MSSLTIIWGHGWSPSNLVTDIATAIAGGIANVESLGTYGRDKFNKTRFPNRIDETDETFANSP